MGAPNASIRVIIGMSIIKEGFGYSDEDLFEKCQFDLLVRKVLGLFSLSDVTPSIDTYYLLRRRICEYENQYSVNLMEKSFEQFTSEQLSTCRISGKCKYRYFTDEQIATAELRRKLAAIPGQEQMKRNNVEATIFQYCYHTRNNKKRYRGLLKHKLYPFAGCSWINHVRLGNYLITIGQRAHEKGLITVFRYIKFPLMEKLFIVIDFLLPRSSEIRNEKSTNYFLKLKIASI